MQNSTNDTFTKLASSFNDFCISKIAKIKDTLLSAKSDSNIYPEPTPSAAPNPLITFSQISESNVSKIIPFLKNLQ